MINRSRSTLFLIEQLIVIAVFAICAAACARILTAAHFNAIDSRDISNAILKAENGAESFKASGGDLALTADILGGTFDSGNNAVIIYFDQQWHISDRANADFVLQLVGTNRAPSPFSPVTGELTVERLNGDQLIAFPIAVSAR